MNIVIDIAINLKINKKRFSKTVSLGLQEPLTQANCRTTQKFISKRNDTVDFLPNRFVFLKIKPIYNI